MMARLASSACVACVADARDAAHASQQYVFSAPPSVAILTFSLRGLWSAPSAMEMVKVMKNENLSGSERIEDCPLNQVYGMSLWEYLAKPENARLRKDFDITLATHAVLFPPDAIAKGEYH